MVGVKWNLIRIEASLEENWFRKVEQNISNSSPLFFFSLRERKLYVRVFFFIKAYNKYSLTLLRHTKVLSI